jgi:hypothetical protein
MAQDDKIAAEAPHLEHSDEKIVGPEHNEKM